MVVTCDDCGMYFDDEFRVTFCPHDTFAANDGHNNFAHHPESYLSSRPVDCDDDYILDNEDMDFEPLYGEGEEP